MTRPKIEDYGDDGLARSPSYWADLENYTDWREGEYKRISKELTDKVKTIHKYLKQIKALELMIEIAKCPNIGCVDGSIAHGSNETGWEQEQCQFCYERKKVLNQ